MLLIGFLQDDIRVYGRLDVPTRHLNTANCRSDTVGDEALETLQLRLLLRLVHSAGVVGPELYPFDAVAVDRDLVLLPRLVAHFGRRQNERLHAGFDEVREPGVVCTVVARFTHNFRVTC